MAVKVCLVFLLLIFLSLHATFGEVYENEIFQRSCKVFSLPCAEKQAFSPAKEFFVIGAGHAKTGTKSLKVALKILGYKSYHMDEMQASGHQKMMTDAYAIGTPVVINEWFDDILRLGFNATVDLPTASFYYEQIQRFPNAKVILTVRDPEAWFKSLSYMFSVAIKSEGIPFIEALHMFTLFDKGLGSNKTKYAMGSSGCYTSSTDVPRYRPWFAPWVSYPNGYPLNKDACIEMFKKHNEEVRKLVPKEQLLELKVTDGWKPLCDFLGVPVPNVPFPSINSKDEFTDFNKFLVFLCYAYPLFFIIPVVSVIGAGLLVKRCFGEGTSVTKKSKTA